MASTYLTRTLGSSSNSGTISMWVKRSKIGSTQYIYANLVSGTNYGIIFFDSNDRIEFMTVTSGSHTQKLLTNRKFRDTSAWYHFVFATDTDNSTATNRLRLYVNGVEETDFDTDATGSQGDTNYLFQASATNDHVISGSASQSDLFDGLMTHIHIVPGSQLAPTVFGETDSTSGIWVPITSPSVTYTAQGSFLKFENSAAMGTDSSGNSNTWTVGGSMTQNVDSPTNNFATFNPLESPEPGEVPTYSNGNLQGVSTNGGHINGISSLAVETGKWYAEFKCTARSGGTDDFIGCIASPAADLGSTNLNDAQSNNKSYGIRGDGSKYEAGSGASFAGSYAINDIIGVGIDATNNRLYFSKNGQWQNGTSWDSASPNSYITLPSGNTWHFLCGDTANSQNYTWQANFGSGFFGTTAVASANADANGHGAMEYAVPSGYYTLNTKNIKEFG